MSLDPITLEVSRHKLDGIADEMQQTLLRASFSPIVKEGLDASAALFMAGHVRSMVEGWDLALAVLSDGRAARKLRDLSRS
jgi:N-methylhydantoinase B